MGLVERFRQFERENSVFQFEVKGVSVWERLRFQIFREVRQQSGTGQAHTSVDLDQSDHVQGAKLWLRNLFRKNPYLAPSSDVLFIGHQRRKLEPDGYWWDLYCDPIHEACNLNSVHFEKPYLLDHRTPAKTESIRYLELITYSGTILRKLGFGSVNLSPDDVSQLKELEKSIQHQFDVDVQLTEKVERLLQNRNCRLPLYKRLLDRVDPNIVVVVVNYGNDMFIEACKEKGIPVVELQHGVIYPNHLGYSYTGNRTKTLFPDYLLTWGEFWNTGVEFPIPDDRVISVGYPYLEQYANQYADTRSREQILFISQGTIGADLSKFALEVSQHPGINHDIVYKLHPGEYDRWRDEYPWLIDADFKVIDSSEPPLYQLFVESSVQVGVYSTAVYEGLAFDLETYIYDCSESRALTPLLEEGAAKLISSADELSSSTGTNATRFDRHHYFAPHSTDRMCEILGQLVDEGTQYLH